MWLKDTRVGVKAALITGSAVVITALISLVPSIFKKGPSDRNITQMTEEGSIIYQEEGTIVVNPPEDQKTNQNAKELNFYKVLQDKLNFLFYSYSSLKILPLFPNNDLGNEFDNKVFQLRRFRLNRPDRYYFYYPAKKAESPRPFNRIVFFILQELQLDKSQLFQQIDNSRELDLVYEILENCQHAIEAFETLWNNTPEGDPNKVVFQFDKTKMTPGEIDSTKVRWHKAEQLNRYFHKIEENITILREQFNAPLAIRVFTEQKEPATIRKYNYNVSEISPSSVRISVSEKKTQHLATINAVTVKDYLVYFFDELRKRQEVIDFYKSNLNSAIAYPEKVQFIVSTTGVVMVHVGHKSQGYPQIEFYSLNEPYQKAMFGEDTITGIPAFYVTERYYVLDYLVIGQNKAHEDYPAKIDSIGGSGRYGDRLIDVLPHADVTLLNCFFHFVRNGDYESLCQEYIYIVGSNEPTIISKGAALDRIEHLCNVLKDRKD